jgi:MobA/VirD2-like, nuclease domain
MPVSVAGGVRKAVGGFLRYVEFRDQHVDPERQVDLDAFVRYVGHRDRTSPAGRVFGRDGGLTDADRHRLVEYVARSTKGLQSRWLRNSKGEMEDHQRAVYQMILSPEDWRGLDLRRTARLAMQQLEANAGPGGLGPWFAAEHRNTGHHHVHIVLAARRELAPGKFSTVLITRKRLQRMKDAIALEIDRQRAPERGRTDKTRPPRRPSATLEPELQHHDLPRWRWASSHASRARARSHSIRHPRSHRAIAASLLQLRGVAQRYQQRMERELEQELIQAEREGWVR